MVYPHASVGQHKREGGREGEREVMEESKGSFKGQRNSVRGEKYSLACAVELHTLAVGARVAKTEHLRAGKAALHRTQNPLLVLYSRSTMSVLIASQLKIDTSTSTGKVRPL